MILRLCVLGWLALGLSGCASYSQGFGRIESLLAQQKPEQALQVLEQTPPSSTNELLYHWDKAMLLRMAGKYQASNAEFEQAKVLVDKLEAVSVVEQAGALTINDSMMSYEGEDFEQIAMHIYAALNYIELGLWDEARVEALQVDERIKHIKEKRDGKAVQDAFASYLSGLIFERGGEYSDAMIAYRQAYKLYRQNKQPVPRFLQHDLLRLSQYLGLKQEHDALAKTFGIKHTMTQRELARKGEVVVLLHHSLAPIKRAEEVFVQREGAPLRISMPVYQSRPDYMQYARLTVGEHVAQTVKVDDFDKLARQSLAMHRAAIMARLVARALIKRHAANQVSDNNGALAGLLVDVAGMITETADTRSWLTLPKDIHLARLPLPPGAYPAKLELLGGSGQVVYTFDLGRIQVDAGKKVLLERTFVAPYQVKP